MAETTNLSIRIDRDLKERAEQVFAGMGINLTTAFNIFIRQTLRQGKIPFEIYAAPSDLDINVPALERSMKQLKEGKVVVKSMEELERIANGE